MAGKSRRRGRGEGSIELLPDGRWRAVLSLGIDPTTGKRKRKKLYGTTKQEVLAKLRAAQADRGQGTLADAGKMTFGQWADKWAELKKPSVENKTWTRDQWTIAKHLKPHLGPVLLSKLSALHVEDLYAKLTAAGVSASGRRRAGVLLGGILRYAVKRHLVPHNVAADVIKPKKTRTEFTSLTVDQAAAFLAAAGRHRLAALFVLALDAGMRPGEMYGLHWPQVDLEAGTVAVLRSLEEIAGVHKLKDVKTPKGRRTLALSALTVKALQRHREAMHKEGWDVQTGPVFVSHNGQWLRQSNVFRRVFRPLLARAGCPAVRFYDLRHTCATLLLANGVNIKIVSERLGHATVTITLDHYAKVLPGMQSVAAECFGRLFGDSPPNGPHRSHSGKSG